jgi:hypothetical protein
MLGVRAFSLYRVEASDPFEEVKAWPTIDLEEDIYQIN